MVKKKTKDIVLSALFLAIGFLLPMLTSQIKEIGDTLLPIHIPVLLCGLICSEKWGFLVGLILPFMRSFVFSMPPIYPNAIYMAAELATYGFIVGFLYSRLRKKNTTSVYISLIGAMISGRIVWGVVKTLLLSLQGKTFTFALFMAGGFFDAIPGIILQLILIPIIMKVINRRKV